jgi:hypothetical protein
VFTLQAIFPFCLPNTEAVPREKEKKKMSAESATAIPRGQVSIFFLVFKRIHVIYWNLGTGFVEIC